MVYRAENRELGEKTLKAFVDKLKMAYPQVTKSLETNPCIFTFYHSPKSIWHSVYSTNLIESFNKRVKKYSMRQEQFSNEDTLERFQV